MRHGGTLLAVGVLVVIGSAHASGVRVSVDPGSLPIDVGEIDILSANLYDYTFGSAPTDWFAGAGLWAITSRWQCSPQWSWQGGEASDGVAVLWNKREFEGDVTVEAYMSFRMGLGTSSSYKNPNDLNITIHGDGANPSSGYSFMVGAARNTETRIMRGTEILARTSDPKALLPIFEDGFPSTYDFHRKWWGIRARKRGNLLQLYLDERLVAQAQDPHPLTRGRVALWTYDNGIIVSRVKIYAEAEAAQRKPVPGMEEIRRPVSVLTQRAFSISSSTHPSVQQNFESDLGLCSSRGDRPTTLLTLSAPGAEKTGHCLEVINLAPGGTFAATLLPGNFNYKETPRLSFDYRLPADQSVRVNLYLTIGGRLCEIIFAGPPTGFPAAQQLGAIPNVVADGAWHHAEFDLLNAVRCRMGTVTAETGSDLWIGNLCEDDYLMAGFGANGLGATYQLDNIILDAPAGRELKLTLTPRERRSLSAYSLVLDQNPFTEPPQETTTTEPTTTLTVPGEGTWYAHVRGMLADGQWTPTEHYRVRVDETGPVVTALTPSPGSALTDGPVTLSLSDPGGSGVDISSLKITVNNKEALLDRKTATYEPQTGLLIVDPRWVLESPGDGEEVRIGLLGLQDGAGNPGTQEQSWTYQISYAQDNVPPPSPRMRIGEDGFLCDEDFETDIGEFSGYGGAGAAELSLDDTTAASGRSSLRVYNPTQGGTFGVYICKRPFDAGRFRIVSFDYKVPPRLRADFAVWVNGEWKAIRFKDRDNNLDRIGEVPNVVDDNQWHHAEFDLYEMLRKRDPQAISYVVRQFVIADWNWRANARGQVYHLDNFRIIPVVSGSRGLPVQWSVKDISGILGASWLVSPQPSADVPPEVKTPGGSALLEGLPNTDGWLHARVCDGAGNWGPVSSSRLLVDNDPPVASALSPPAGANTAVSNVELSLTDNGVAGIDPTSIVLSVGGVEYNLENRGLIYDSNSGRLVWNCEEVSPQAVVFPDKAIIEVKLKAAADFAGNLLRQPPAWTWIMDYSQDRTPPRIARVQSSTHDTFLADTFEEGVGGWRTLGGENGALVQRDETTAASGSASIKLVQQKTGGAMSAYITTDRFSPAKYPVVSFDYRIPASVKLDLIARLADGREFAVALTDNPSGALGSFPDVKADGDWHRTSVDLQSLLRTKYEQGPPEVTYLYLADRNRMENPAGASAWFDNFVISAVGQTPPVIRWRATDATGIAGYSYALDQEPATVPDEIAEGAGRSFRFRGSLKPGLWFFHIRALDGAGNWGPALHYGLLHQKAS